MGGEGVVYSQKELVLSEPEQGLRRHRSAKHGPGCLSGLRRGGATWYPRSSGCGGYWNCAALCNGRPLCNGQVSAASSSREAQEPTAASDAFLCTTDELALPIGAMVGRLLTPA